MSYDFDLLVIGTGVGGLAFAKEASFANKKVAVIHFRSEEEDEEEKLYDDEPETEDTPTQVEDSVQKEVLESLVSGIRSEEYANEEADGEFSLKSYPNIELPKPWTRKVRKMDQGIMVRNYAKFGRKILRKIAKLRESISDAESCGWEVNAPEKISSQWTKMTNYVRNYIIKENSRLINDFKERQIQYFIGVAEFVDSHTVKFTKGDSSRNITSEYICISPNAVQFLPHWLPGIRSFGIKTDDFLLIEEPPGKTLVVGGDADSLECAGIIASFGFPVTLMYEYSLLCGYDYDIIQMIVEDMERRSVKFLNKHLISVRLNETQERLIAQYKKVEWGFYVNHRTSNSELEEEEFDTVLMYSHRRLSIKQMKLRDVNLRVDSIVDETLMTEAGETNITNIIAVGDVQMISKYPEKAELTGRLLARKIFLGEKLEIENHLHPFPPEVIHTPTEYAFVGATDSVELARDIIGKTVYESFSRPIEFTVPFRKEKCYMKVVCANEDGKVIGIHIFGPDAGEIIQGFAVALKCGLTMTQLRCTVGVHGTKAEEIPRIKARKRTQMDRRVPNKPTRMISRFPMEH